MAGCTSCSTSPSSWARCLSRQVADRRTSTLRGSIDAVLFVNVCGRDAGGDHACRLAVHVMLTMLPTGVACGEGFKPLDGEFQRHRSSAGRCPSSPLLGLLRPSRQALMPRRLCQLHLAAHGAHADGSVPVFLAMLGRGTTGAHVAPIITRLGAAVALCVPDVRHGFTSYKSTTT